MNEQKSKNFFSLIRAQHVHTNLTSSPNDIALSTTDSDSISKLLDAKKINNKARGKTVKEKIKAIDKDSPGVEPLA
tara:strand:+ start:606 stop:833 length:228 start_codon:yes stop_codon:yes gene_type:complete